MAPIACGLLLVAAFAGVLSTVVTANGAPPDWSAHAHALPLDSKVYLALEGKRLHVTIGSTGDKSLVVHPIGRHHDQEILVPLKDVRDIEREPGDAAKAPVAGDRVRLSMAQGNTIVEGTLQTLAACGSDRPTPGPRSCFGNGLSGRA